MTKTLVKTSSANDLELNQDDAAKQIVETLRQEVEEPREKRTASSGDGQPGDMTLKPSAESAKPKKDAWDKISAVAPIISGAMIFLAGGYFTFSYNQQQLRVQEIQTIEKFIPHLTGSEQSKKAAILAISSLADARLAGKIAALFASQGTVSALKSISESGNEKDREAAQAALSRALENLSQRESRLDEIESAYRQALLDSNPSNFDQIDSPVSLIKIAQSYKNIGQTQLSEHLLKRAIQVADRSGQSDSFITADAYRRLSELSTARGNRSQTDTYMRKARAIEAKLAHDASSEAGGQADSSTEYQPADHEPSEKSDGRKAPPPAQAERQDVH